MDADELTQTIERVRTFIFNVGKTPVEDINYDYDLAFAIEVYNQSEEDKDELILCRSSSRDIEHFWIQFNGKHYDYEVPSGVNDWRDLPKFDGKTPDEYVTKSFDVYSDMDFK